MEHFYPNLRDAWAIPLDEFCERLRCMRDLQALEAGEDLTLRRMQRLAERQADGG